MDRFDLEAIVHQFIIDSVISRGDRCYESDLERIFKLSNEYDIAFATTSQYSFPQGRSACTSIALTAAIGLLEASLSQKFTFTPEELDSYVLNGIQTFSELTKGQLLEHTNPMELVISLPFSSKLVPINYGNGDFYGAQGIWGQKHNLKNLIKNFADSVLPSQYYALVLTKPPETILLILPPKDENNQKYFIFDSHSRPFLMVKNSAYFVSTNSLDNLINLVQFIFPVNIQGMDEDSMMEIYNSFELNCFQLNIPRQENLHHRSTMPTESRNKGYVIEDDDFKNDESNNLDQKNNNFIESHEKVDPEFDFQRKQLVESFIEKWSNKYVSENKQLIRKDLTQITNEIKFIVESTQQSENSHQLKINELIQENEITKKQNNDLNQENAILKENNEQIVVNNYEMRNSIENYEKRMKQLNDNNNNFKKQNNDLNQENAILKEKNEQIAVNNDGMRNSIENFEKWMKQLSDNNNNFKKQNEQLGMDTTKLKSDYKALTKENRLKNEEIEKLKNLINGRNDEWVRQLQEGNDILMKESEQLKMEIKRLENENNALKKENHMKNEETEKSIDLMNQRSDELMQTDSTENFEIIQKEETPNIGSTPNLGRTNRAFHGEKKVQSIIEAP